MSAVVISSSERFSVLSKRLRCAGFSDIRFCDARYAGSAHPAMDSVDFMVLGSDAGSGADLMSVVAEAKGRKITVLPENAFGGRVALP